MATPYNAVSHDAAQALTEFSSAFDRALVATDPATTWAALYGYVHTTNAIKSTFPIPLDAPGYHEFKGDMKYRRLYERSLSMKTKTWQDGVEEYTKVIEAPDFIGWLNAPANMAREANRHPMKLVAAMLHANPLLDLYREEFDGGSVASTLHLFDNTHPYNILDTSVGTFDNDQAAVEIGATMVEAVSLRFANRRAPNGERMGLRFNTLLVPAALSEVAKNFFEPDTLALAVMNAAGTEVVGGIPRNNRYKSQVNVVICDELQDDNIVYALDATSTCSPWIIQTVGAPEEIRRDKDSDYWKSTLKVSIAYILEQAVAACLPHAIERITLTG